MVIDGKCDIIYCVVGDTKEAQKFNVVKTKEEKKPKLKNMLNNFELKQQKINNNTIIEYETELSKYNKKTLSAVNLLIILQRKMRLIN